MTTVASLFAVALALVFEQTGPARLTHAEGRVVADPAGVRTGGGRAEVRLPDGALVHLDAGTVLRYAPSGLLLEDGRIVLRLRGDAVVVDTPTASFRAFPDAVLTMVVDRERSRLLVALAYGEGVLTTRYGHVSRIIGGQSAIMTGSTGVPWATAYTRAELDAFAIWSDMRIASAGLDLGPAGDWAASTAPGSTAASEPCTSFPVYGAPCWTLPPPRPGAGPPGPPFAPSYAPSYTPNYAPGFTAPPPGAAPAPSTGTATPSSPAPGTPAPGAAAAPAGPGAGAGAPVPKRPPSP